MSGEQRGNAKRWPQPFGLRPKIGVSGYAFLRLPVVSYLTKMAGVPGFEPGNAEIKTPCLATWLHPNCLKAVSVASSDSSQFID
jgi:hypothetical protein